MSRSRCISILATSVFAVAVAFSADVHADGGKVQFSQIVAPYRITVFTSPTPLGAGTIDISILLQDAETDAFVQDADIELELCHDSPTTTIRIRADTAASTNKLLHSAKFTLPAAGTWHVTVKVQGQSKANARFNLIAYPASGDSSTLLACLTIPFLVIALFLFREHLAACQSRNSKRSTAMPTDSQTNGHQHSRLENISRFMEIQ